MHIFTKRLLTSIAVVLTVPMGAAAAGERPMLNATYLQATFSPSADDCKAREAAWRKAHSQRDKQLTAECFLNATPPPDSPERRQMPPYLFQVVSTGPALQQPSSSPMTFTYRALGEVQLAKDQQGASATPLGSGEIKFYQMMVFNSPQPDQEAAYNEWYDHQHVPDVMRVGGFISGQRFRMIGGNENKDFQLPSYVVVFTLQSGDLKATGADIGARIKDGRTRMSPAFKPSGGAGIFVTPLK